MNFYDVHYNSTHVMGTTGGNTADMIESLELTAEGRIDPAVMVTHIGGLDSAAETTLNLPKIPGGKKLIYTHLSMPLTALSDLRAKGEETKDQRLVDLADIVDAHNGLWCPEAEEYLLKKLYSGIIVSGQPVCVVPAWTGGIYGFNGNAQKCDCSADQ